MEHVPCEQLLLPFTVLVILFISRAVVAAIRERVGFICGQVVRRDIRRTVLDKLEQLGPVRVKGKPAGS